MTQTATKTNATTHKGIETTGIEIVKESQRTARPQDLFLPWFASNVSVFGMSYGAFMLGFGVSFWQAIAATLVGVTVSFGFCGIIAIAGKRGSHQRWCCLGQPLVPRATRSPGSSPG